MFDINQVKNVSVAIICDKKHRSLYLSDSCASINTELDKSTCNKIYIYI